jgi:glycosyltransferase involved in cell wall biosynthesis
MRLAVISHKPCWSSASSPSGYATDGGFPFQMKALSELFERTTLVVPCSRSGDSAGEIPLTGKGLSIKPLSSPGGRGIYRKLRLPFWLIRNSLSVIREIWRADAVHTPIPGDIGTIGMLLAFISRKPLFVRHCGNWFVQKTAAEHFWKWFMERFAGGRQVMLATGGAADPPSSRNGAIRWIFSTTLTEEEMRSCVASQHEPAQRARLIIACRQDPEKGAGVVIESLPLILKDLPDATLDVVGDGPALSQFRRRAVELGVNDVVTFHGKVDHKRVLQLLQRANVFLYPTAASEGFPKIVLEALACGLPVITTAVSVLPQLISSGCGVLLETQAPSAVAQAVGRIISDPERYQSMRVQAYETAKQYSLERWLAMINELLQTAWKPIRSDV